MAKEKKKRIRRSWTRNDVELTLLALPTTVWYLLFCFLPMFGLIIAFKNYRAVGERAFSTMYCTAIGRDLRILNFW